MSDPKSQFVMAQGSDQSLAGLRVDPLARPNGMREDGTIVKPHPSMGTTMLDEAVHFVCSEVTAVMHRPDGKKLAFLFGHFATKIKQDVDYLMGELSEGHPFLALATPEQVRNYNMRTDPRGTLSKELRPQIEAELSASLEAKIRAQVIAELTGQDPSKVEAGEKDEARLAGTQGNGADQLEVIKTGNATIRLGGAVPDNDIAAKLAAAKAAQRPPITPVSSADIAGAAAGSGGQE